MTALHRLEAILAWAPVLAAVGIWALIVTVVYVVAYIVAGGQGLEDAQAIFVRVLDGSL